LAAEIRPQHQGRGLAAKILDVMAELTREAGLGHLLAPVRPSLKERYRRLLLGAERMDR
jgi:L-amino acid N-acyltransferase YncA